MSPKITANRQDEEPSRIDRLNRLAEVLLTKGVTKIIGLHDHKGTLYVNWSATPSTSELTTVISAWAAEYEPHSNHAVNGRPLVSDVGGDNPFGGPHF
ncbi:hypothetical protein QCM77_09330 [Bradyrhizobium sp. SSUT18]|uniref:hypothetical protein n=1 Tax=Bradyrhizobium sp. SSUT18 TaxID=3040602 RepID=UPI00244C9495|nr:hypothetical protein [Bradyrhizobium sp. SSUT18]MDH2400145.1 hypothetical protein [Bradyrhizobium sp. SSUT18]